MRRKNTCLVLLAVCVSLALSLVGCGDKTSSSSVANDGSLQRVLDKGQLVMGLDAGFPPMGFKDKTNTLVGFDIDVAQEVCDRLGIELVKWRIDWDEKESELNEGHIDCIWNGLAVTPARAEYMSFTDPYMKNELVCLVPGNSNVKVLQDLKGHKVGVQPGATSQDALEASAIYPDIEVREYDTVLALLEGIEKNEVDAIIIDSVSVYYFIGSTDEVYYVLPESLAEEDFAIGFRKEDQTLREKIQSLLSDMKADGTLAEISNKWFGGDITTVR